METRGGGAGHGASTSPKHHGDDREETPLLGKSQDGTCRTFAKGVKSAFTSGAGLCADGYDLFIVDVVVQVLFHLYDGQMKAYHKGFAMGMTYFGVIAGQLFFGVACDTLGTRRVSLVTAGLQVVGCAAATCCMPSDRFAIGWQLGICRFVLGLGVGGEFPVSQHLSTGKEQEGLSGLAPSQKMVLNGVLFQVGVIVAPFILIILTRAEADLEVVWRVPMAMGTVPSLAAFALRLSEREAFDREPATPRDSLLVQVSSQWWTLLGCGSLWMLHNLLFFSLGSFKSLMNERVYAGGKEWATEEQMIAHDSIFVLYTSVCTFVASCAMMPVIVRVRHHGLSFLMFLGLTVALFACGALLMAEGVPNWLLLCCLYFALFFASCLGCVMFTIAGLSFRPELRATCFGIAAASGKLGALIGTAIFPVLEATIGLGAVLCIWGGVGIFGCMGSVIFAPPDQGVFAMFRSFLKTGGSWSVS